MKKRKKMIFWLIGIVSFIVVLFGLIGWFISAPGYNGPESDHFDGRKFYNPGGDNAKGLYDVVKWMINREKGPWQAVDNQPKRLPAEGPRSGDIRITFINHSTILLQGEGHTILTDPIWSERTSPVSWTGPKRMRNPGIAFEDLPPVDVVLISHNHYDHLDLPTVKHLARRFNPHFITPLGVGKFLKNNSITKVSEFDWGDSTAISDGLSIIATPAKHFSGRGWVDRNATLWCGYIMRFGDNTIFFAGDTGYGPLFRKIKEDYGPVKAALIPIGAYKPEWFMSPIHVSPEEAVKIHKDLNAGLSIGIHHGTFPLADDGMEAPLLDLQKAKQDLGVSDNSFITLDHGEFVEIH